MACMEQPTLKRQGHSHLLSSPTAQTVWFFKELILKIGRESGAYGEPAQLTSGDVDSSKGGEMRKVHRPKRPRQEKKTEQWETDRGDYTYDEFIQSQSTSRSPRKTATAWCKKMRYWIFWYYLPFFNICLFHLTLCFPHFTCMRFKHDVGVLYSTLNQVLEGKNNTSYISTIFMFSYFKIVYIYLFLFYSSFQAKKTWTPCSKLFLFFKKCFAILIVSVCFLFYSGVCKGTLWLWP